MASPAARARTPTLAPGNSLVSTRAPKRQLGFTLIELLVVITLIAIAAGTASLALRDPEATQLDREAERLAALLESARAEARADGLEVAWSPVIEDSSGAVGDNKAQFRFSGMPPQAQLPQRWLGAGVTAQILGADRIQLGPEPMIGPQRILLSLGNQRVMLTTDGLAPFEVEHPSP
ncbi:MAG: prepilin-type N-terminal cleavage/methylation domain-containing protein [Paucibacter sp.]|nr:prepilin-type N-terminal cleavage/methylation domain-containing protein [Roseateles sp.]